MCAHVRSVYACELASVCVCVCTCVVGNIAGLGLHVYLTLCAPLCTAARRTCSPAFSLWPSQFCMHFWSLKADVWIAVRERKRVTFSCTTAPRPVTSCTRWSWTRASGRQPASLQRCLGVWETRVVWTVCVCRCGCMAPMWLFVCPSVLEAPGRTAGHEQNKNLRLGRRED